MKEHEAIGGGAVLKPRPQRNGPARRGLLLLCALAVLLSACQKGGAFVIEEDGTLALSPDYRLAPLQLSTPLPEGKAAGAPAVELLLSREDAPSPTPLVVEEPTPRPTPTDKLDAGDGVYTVAWLSDTQHYSANYREIYPLMTQFLADNRERMNLKYIVHTGDLVHSRSSESQWEVADAAQKRIDHIPNGVLAGNHDARYSEDSSKYYSQYFGAARYSGKAWYGAAYQDNRGHYDLVDVGRTPFVFVYMSYAPDESAFTWVEAVFKEHSTRVGVLCVHDYFKTSLERSGDGERFFDRVVEECPNVYLVLCGHRYTQACEKAGIDADGDGRAERAVYQMMNNYQACDEGGSGYIRFLQIDEKAQELRVYSYSPYTEDYNYYDNEGAQGERYASDPKNEEYTLPLPWTLQ